MAAFADYEYYSTEYGGAAIPPEAFDRIAVRASRDVNTMTLGKAGARRDISEIKDAVCAVSEVLYTAEQREKEYGGKASETVGSFSVSFRSVSEDFGADSIQGAAYNAARPYLFAAGLLYRGIC